MQKTLTILIICLVISACKKEYMPREKVNVSIQKFQMDSSSIRAIEIVNDSSIAYAGSNGEIGIMTGSGKLKATKKIITDTITPHFRALGYTKKAFFALSIGNPALLYKYENDQIEIVYKEEHEKIFYDALHFFDTLNGIAIGDPTEGCLSVLITRDGGNSWGKVACDDLPESEEGEAAFAASNTNIAIVGKQAWIATGGIKARVFHTPDMGLSWKVYNTPVIQGKNTTGIYSIAFFNENQGIICGGDYTDKFGNSGNKAITNNGGKTWKLVAENTAPNYVSCVQYVPETDGKEVFAVSTNGIFYSNDAGQGWIKVSEEGFYSIRFASKNIAWLSGNQVIAKMEIN